MHTEQRTEQRLFSQFSIPVHGLVTLLVGQAELFQQWCHSELVHLYLEIKIGLRLLRLLFIVLLSKHLELWTSLQI